MSKYTTEVRFICETESGLDASKGFNDVDEIIEASIPKIFSFTFPIFDEEYRNVLCTKILRHYYTREIGLETVGLWKLKLQTKLDEIMPYYNKLYESELIKFNPLYDVDLNTTHVGDKNSENVKDESKNGTFVKNEQRSETGTVSESGTSQNNTTGTSIENNKEIGNDETNKVNANNYSENNSDLNYDLYSDTPQGGLTGVDAESYLTNARKITDTKTTSGKKDDTEVAKNKYDKEAENNAATNSNSRDSFNTSRENGSSINNSENNNSFENLHGNDKFNSTESYVLHVVGKQAGVSYSKLLKEFRDTFLNIDMDVINSLSDLFLNLW